MIPGLSCWPLSWTVSPGDTFVQRGPLPGPGVTVPWGARGTLASQRHRCPHAALCTVSLFRSTRSERMSGRGGKLERGQREMSEFPGTRTAFSSPTGRPSGGSGQHGPMRRGCGALGKRAGVPATGPTRAPRAWGPQEPPEARTSVAQLSTSKAPCSRRMWPESQRAREQVSRLV